MIMPLSVDQKVNNSLTYTQCAMAQHSKSPLNIQISYKNQTASSDELNYLFNCIAQTKAYKKCKFGKHEKQHMKKLLSAKYSNSIIWQTHSKRSNILQTVLYEILSSSKSTDLRYITLTLMTKNLMQ